MKASDSVAFVCQTTERCFQQMCCVMGDKLPRTDKILFAITSVVLKEVALKCFHSLSYHM